MEIDNFLCIEIFMHFSQSFTYAEFLCETFNFFFKLIKKTEWVCVYILKVY